MKNQTFKDSPKTDAGKRVIVIPAGFGWIMEKLRTYNPQNEYVFVDEKGDRIIAARMRKRVYYLCHKLGIEAKSPHKIRKTYATILMDHHLDNLFITEQMRHTDIACTEQHYHFNRKDIEQKIAIINSIPEFISV